jgi:hypothetical protein
MAKTKRNRWRKRKPIEEGVSTGCLCCGHKASLLSMDRVLAVGFGMVQVTKGKEPVWSGDDMDKTIREFEERARKEPGDWRVRFDAPLWNGVWQRHTKDTWVLIEKGQGFA